MSEMSDPRLIKLFGKKQLESELKICINKLWNFGRDFIKKVCDPKINVGGNSVFFKSLFYLGIVFIYDFLDAYDNIYSFDYIKSVLKSK